MASDKKADSSVAEGVGANHVKLSGQLLIGRKVKIWWPLEKMFRKGKIIDYNGEEKMHMVVYDGDITELVDISKERWQLVKGKGSSSDPSNAAENWVSAGINYKNPCSNSKEGAREEGIEIKKTYVMPVGW